MISTEDDDANIIFGTIINHILQKGKPKQILVRDRYILSVLIDLCKQVDIKIFISEKLKAIDEFVESFCKYGR